MSNQSETHFDTKDSKMATKPQQSEYSIFVGGLSSRCTERDLFDYFNPFGRILRCEPQMWKKSNMRCRGFALIHCGDKQTYDSILNKKRHVFQGRNIECKQYLRSREKLNKYNRDLIQRKMFVGGLPPEATTADLEHLFSKIGEIDIAYIITHHRTGRSKGFGYICFKDTRARDRALAIRDFTMFGKTVSCSEYSHKFLFKEGGEPQEVGAKEQRLQPQGRKGMKRGRGHPKNRFGTNRRKRFKSQVAYDISKRKKDEEADTCSPSKLSGRRRRQIALMTTDYSSSVSGFENTVKVKPFSNQLFQANAFDFGLPETSKDLDCSLAPGNWSGAVQKDPIKSSSFPQSSKETGVAAQRPRKRNGFSLFGSLDGKELCRKFGFNA